MRIATTRAQPGGLGPPIAALAETEVVRRVAALGGYDTDGAGEVLDVG